MAIRADPSSGVFEARLDAAQVACVHRAVAERRSQPEVGPCIDELSDSFQRTSEPEVGVGVGRFELLEPLEGLDRPHVVTRGVARPSQQLQQRCRFGTGPNRCLGQLHRRVGHPVLEQPLRRAEQVVDVRLTSAHHGPR